MEAAEVDQVKRLIDDALKVHLYDHHKNRCATTFKPPTREEVLVYCRETNLPLNVDKFMDFYASKGWKVGKVTMKDWKCAARNAVRDGWCTGGQVNPGPKKTKLFPIAGKNCSIPGCKMPAVYKAAGGAYDHYYCAEHMPEKVKERFE